MNDDLEVSLREYDSISESFWRLADVRFKLLALVPTISGIAVALLTGESSGRPANPIPHMLIALMGLIVTLGVIMYDQRNSQIYNALARRAKSLEEKLFNGGGTFHARPERTLRLFRAVTIWHDRGLALIYGSVVGAWFFPLSCGAMSLWGRVPDGYAVTLAAAVAIVAGAVTVAELHRLDRNA